MLIDNISKGGRCKPDSSFIEYATYKILITSRTIQHYHILKYIRTYICMYVLIFFEASRGAAARGVTVKPTGCGFDPHSRR